MDRHLERIARVDNDLVVCELLGFAYQRDMRVTAKYDEGYFAKCAGYEGAAIAEAINRGRIDFVARHAGSKTVVCDIGIGSGEFIKLRGNALGYDVNPVARKWLEDNSLLADLRELPDFDAVTFWDVLEHVPDPGEYLIPLALGARVFVSVPIFTDLMRIRESRHYRPGEHLYYFTRDGFVTWMRSYGFDLREHATFEIDAGREAIHSFAMQKVTS